MSVVKEGGNCQTAASSEDSSKDGDNDANDDDDKKGATVEWSEYRPKWDENR